MTLAGVVPFLLTAPFVVGTFGDLFGVTFDAVDNGFRVGVNLAVAVVFVDDVPNEVLVARLCDYNTNQKTCLK